jgi:hypothetical protein
LLETGEEKDYTIIEANYAACVAQQQGTAFVSFWIYTNCKAVPLKNDLKI